MDPEKETEPQAQDPTPVESDPASGGEQAEPQGGGNDGMVEIHEAEIADLDAALANAQAEEASEATETESATTAASTKPTPEAAPKAQANGATSQEPSATAPAAGTSAGNAQDTSADDRKKELNQKELFIQHRGNELTGYKAQIAKTRTDLVAVRAQLANGLEDRLNENPAQALEDRDKIKDIDAQLANLDATEERATKLVEAQTFFLRNVDTKAVSVDDVAEVLKSDGIADQYIAQFKANPWEFTTPEALVQMGRRAMDRKFAVQADNDRRILAKHVLAQNEELAKLKAKPRQVLAQVQKNLNKPQAITSSSSSAPKASRDLDPTRMSIQELDAAIANASAN